jgi:hypothetical protein
MRLVLVRLAQRPVDEILRRAWKLCDLDNGEFLKNVYAVWCNPPSGIFTWTFEYMLDYLDKNPSWEVGDKAKWANVQKLVPEWKKTPTPSWLLKPVIGYYEGPNRINLEDGHTRLTAAHLAKAFPATITMYLGERPATP